MELQDNGLLEPGFHTISVDDMEESFVVKFVTSQKRNEIFESLVQFMRVITDSYRVQEVWIDGSFVTSKINPNDVDIVIFLEVEDFISLSKSWNYVRNVSNIDAYIAVAINDELQSKLPAKEYGQVINNRNYWRGQFGFDRADNPKGLLVITGEEWNSFYTERGEKDVISVN